MTGRPYLTPAPVHQGNGEWGVGRGVLRKGCRAPQSRPPSRPPPAGYALPTTGVNHVRISGNDRYGCCFERLTQWQCAAPAVVSRAEWAALHAHHVRVAQFGVRQLCCRASCAHDPARGVLLPILVTGVLNALVPLIASVRHACELCA